MSATHYAYYETAPSESDPDGDEAVACGADFAQRTTGSRDHVTCKRCLKALAKSAAAIAQRGGESGNG